MHVAKSWKDLLSTLMFAVARMVPCLFVASHWYTALSCSSRSVTLISLVEKTALLDFISASAKNTTIGYRVTVSQTVPSWECRNKWAFREKLSSILPLVVTTTTIILDVLHLGLTIKRPAIHFPLYSWLRIANGLAQQHKTFADTVNSTFGFRYPYGWLCRERRESSFSHGCESKADRHMINITTTTAVRHLK